MRRFVSVFCALVLSALAALPARADTPSAPAARIAAALDNIIALPRADEVGYATIWDGNRYIQCAPALRGGGLRCEAAGVLMQPSLARVLTSDRVRQLSALGWRLDPHFGNYVQTFAASKPRREVAEAILRALTEAYGADLGELEVRTAWVPAEACPPRNGPTQNLAGMVNDAPEMARFAVHACAYVAPTPGPAPVGSADALIARYGPRVTAELDRLRVNVHSDKPFVVFQTGIGYIQCHPDSPPDLIYCEAQSADSWAALSGVLTPERIARLHAAGYADPGRAPNYWKNYPLDKFDDDAIAREVITLLHDIYGYDGAVPLKYGTEDGDEP